MMNKTKPTKTKSKAVRGKEVVASVGFSWVDDFIDSFSHEMRTPLTSICACSQILTHQNEAPIPDELRDLLEMIDRDSQRIARMVDNIVMLMDLERGKSVFNLERFSANEAIIDEVNHFGEFGRKKDVKIDLHLPKNPLFVKADPKKFRTLLNHLLDNAVIHGTEGKPIEIRLAASDGKGVVTVKNEGHPILCSNPAEPFKKYWQSNRGDLTQKPPGLGIGLTICKYIVDALGGKIGYEPKGKKTHLFQFTVPLHR